MGIYAKYFVIKRFELALNSSEMVFKQMSGENTWAAVFSYPKLLREKLNEFL
nr:hypothetical protein [uncultured Campylobacter sp.]